MVFKWCEIRNSEVAISNWKHHWSTAWIPSITGKVSDWNPWIDLFHCRLAPSPRAVFLERIYGMSCSHSILLLPVQFPMTNSWRLRIATIWCHDNELKRYSLHLGVVTLLRLIIAPQWLTALQPQRVCHQISTFTLIKSIGEMAVGAFNYPTQTIKLTVLLNINFLLALIQSVTSQQDFSIGHQTTHPCRDVTERSWPKLYYYSESFGITEL